MKRASSRASVDTAPATGIARGWAGPEVRMQGPRPAVAGGQSGTGKQGHGAVPRFTWHSTTQHGKRDVDDLVHRHLVFKADHGKHGSTDVDPTLGQETLEEGAQDAHRDTAGPAPEGGKGSSQGKAPQLWPSCPLPNSSSAPEGVLGRPAIVLVSLGFLPCSLLLGAGTACRPDISCEREQEAAGVQMLRGLGPGH